MRNTSLFQNFSDRISYKFPAHFYAIWRMVLYAIFLLLFCILQTRMWNLRSDIRYHLQCDTTFRSKYSFFREGQATPLRSYHFRCLFFNPPFAKKQKDSHSSSLWLPYRIHYCFVWPRRCTICCLSVTSSKAELSAATRHQDFARCITKKQRQP